MEIVWLYGRFLEYADLRQQHIPNGQNKQQQKLQPFKYGFFTVFYWVIQPHVQLGASYLYIAHS